MREGLSRQWTRIDPWTAATIVFLLALNLSGRVCYEASRLAWFCFPLLALAAAQSLPPPGKGRNFVPGLLLAGQAAATIAIRMVF